MRSFVLVSVLCLALFSFCTSTPTNQPAAATSSKQMPADAGPANVTISDLNCWVERGQFFVTGICDNRAGEWQKIWLRLQPLDPSGNRITVNGDSSVVFATLSDAVPPRGRTSFFVEWPVSAFSGSPDSCIITGAGAELTNPGPILAIIENNGIKMIVPDTIANDSVIALERAWQVNALVENPLEMEARHLRLELLVYDTDQRLWFATVLNPEDPEQKATLYLEREGPMAPHEKRRIGTNIYYDNLPQALRAKKIGRVEFQPFNAAQ